MDWRALSQVKELGLIVKDSPEIGKDLEKIFQMYWLAASSNQIPPHWPPEFETKYNLNNPLVVTLFFCLLRVSD